MRACRDLHLTTATKVDKYYLDSGSLQRVFEQSDKTTNILDGDDTTRLRTGEVTHQTNISSLDVHDFFDSLAHISHSISARDSYNPLCPFDIKAFREFLKIKIAPLSHSCFDESQNSFREISKDKIVRECINLFGQDLANLFTKLCGSSPQLSFHRFSNFLTTNCIYGDNITGEVAKTVFVEINKMTSREGSSVDTGSFSFEEFVDALVALSLFQYPSLYQSTGEKLKQFVAEKIFPEKREKLGGNNKGGIIELESHACVMIHAQREREYSFILLFYHIYRYQSSSLCVSSSQIIVDVNV